MLWPPWGKPAGGASGVRIWPQDILLLRGQRVISDRRLAVIYGVQTRAQHPATMQGCIARSELA